MHVCKQPTNLTHSRLLLPLLLGLLLMALAGLIYVEATRGIIAHHFLPDMARRAEAARVAGENELAETICEQGLFLAQLTRYSPHNKEEWDPEYELILSASDAYEAENKTAAKLSMYKKAEEYFKRNGDVKRLIGLGRLYYCENYESTAERIFRDSIELCSRARLNDRPMRVWALSELGTLHSKTSRLADAEIELEEVCGIIGFSQMYSTDYLMRDVPETYMLTLIEEGKWEKASAILDKNSKLEQDDISDDIKSTIRHRSPEEGQRLVEQARKFDADNRPFGCLAELWRLTGDI